MKTLFQILGVDPDREHVLILYGVCEISPDSRSVFKTPHSGAGWRDQRHDLCHASDCSLLDPALLPETDRRMAIPEHDDPRRERIEHTFNSWYLGGLAHELCHRLGFPHDIGSLGEGPRASLMGI